MVPLAGMPATVADCVVPVDALKMFALPAPVVPTYSQYWLAAMPEFQPKFTVPQIVEPGAGVVRTAAVGAETVTFAESDGIPLATTSRVEAPVSMPAGTETLVEEAAPGAIDRVL